MVKKSLTVAIITKNRPESLTRVLESIKQQDVAAESIFIVDNDGNGSAGPVGKKFKNCLNIEYFKIANKTVAELRNRAIEECKTDLLAFVDDDCVLNNKWIKEAKRFSYNKSAYLLGKSLALDNKNLVSLALFCRQSFWFNREIEKNNGVPTPFCVDTKNVVFNVSTLKKTGVMFDTSLYLDKTDGHTDTDFGFQLVGRGVYGSYNPLMILMHQEVDTISGLTRKAYFRGKAGWGLYKKWNLKNELVFLPEYNWCRWLIRIKNWPEEYRKWLKPIKDYPLVKKISVFLLIKLYDRKYLDGFVSQAKISW